MESLKDLSDINCTTIEGRYLFAAVALLTSQPKLKISVQEMNGEQMHPNEMLHHLHKIQEPLFKVNSQPSDISEEPIPAKATEGPKTFIGDLEAVINKYSKESGSDTPDFILASYMNQCFQAFDDAVNARNVWYGKGTEIK